MAKNNELIHRGKALKDLRGIKDVLMAQGDPFLASVMNRAIECIENQPAAQPTTQPVELPTMDAIKECATCTHNTPCTAQANARCHNCRAVCTCKECVDYSKWESGGSNGW